MKRLLLIVLPLLLIVGCSKVEGKQDLIPVVETYDNGNIKSIVYHKKSRTGIEKVKYEGYHKNGQKWLEETYKDGKLNGLWTYWDENGEKKREGNYKDGKRDGKWTEWSGGGTSKFPSIMGPYHKSFEKTYKDGKEISSKSWNEDGTEQ